MPVPLFPLLGTLNESMLLDLTTVFTPLTLGLVALCSLCGVGLALLIARTDAVGTTGTATLQTTPPVLRKAA
jgi:hypothetical protein